MAAKAPAGDYILKLRDVTRRDSDRAGAKAANLGELAAAGFPVPDGFVLTSAAFERFLADNAIPADGAPAAAPGGLVPAKVADALVDAAADLGDVPLAVRSSGLAEDLPGASFAGQYVTTLDVRGAAALIEAVRRCWASAFSERVAAYRAARGQSGVPSVAVLVQRLVRADAAGVAFTANPITGDRTETLVSAVRGLGERLVSGQATPDEWVVKGNEAVRRGDGEDAIDAAQALAIANLARRVEAHFGHPQDVEWALADRRLFLLQARPITALPEETPSPVPVEPPPGFWQREASHYPQPISPMFRVLLAAFNAGMRRMMDELSVLVETVEFREIGGWVYQRTVPLGGTDRPAPPAWLMPLLIRVVPRMRARIDGAVATVRSDKIGSSIERWHAEWKPALIAEIERLQEVDLAALSDEALDRHLAAAIALFRRSMAIHTLVNGAVLVTLAETAFAGRDLLGWEDGRTFELFSGLSERSSEPSRRLADLARMAAERPAIRELVERIDGDTVRRLADADRGFADAFAAYQREFGCRVLGIEVAEPTLAETPTLVLGLIRDQIVRGYDPAADAAALEQQRAAAVADARTALADRPPRDRERFERALARGERAYPIREDNQFYAVSAPMALVRYAVLELGRRLADREQLAARDDIFFLEIDEARAALRDGGDRRSLAGRRRAERAWVESHPGPASYGKDPGPPPSFAALPAEARFLVEALLWAQNRVFAAAEHDGHLGTPGRALRGIAASPGRYTGPARVILGESEFAKLRAGDVLVCPMTSPVWSVLFPSVGALVTDAGGILSHPAIIAREFRVPAVVATGNATRLIRDGQVVTVDGTAGRAEMAS